MNVPGIQAGVVLGVLIAACQFAWAADPPPTSYMPVVMQESLAQTIERMEAAKPTVESRQKTLLDERYDLSDSPAGASMTRGKAIQGGVRAKLPAGVTWDELGNMTPEEIKSSGKWPAGFFPLPHPNHPEGGMVFPKFHIDEIKKQEQRDLTRFDLDYDLPDQFLPEFPPPIFLTTRPGSGRCVEGQLVTIDEFLRAVQRALEPEAARGSATAW